ncbi:hypothetical protein JQC91_08510 [Jannaschia sp. Os4]|uniref:hypothetical protein n=1 Tax=Jannaschia sp. Os4 TaxID=2807617 RepID=UPI00193A1231|nr:hypothetical protein [Jannaschia sp. Os4]MBM2576347.1 hypothetical protein [Jannaschia sp. Os4]
MQDQPFDARRLPVETLKAKLLAERPGLSALDREALLGSAALERNTDNWVRSWIDTEHVVTHRSKRVVATRAITDSGLLIWMVRLQGNRFAFHSDREGVDDAFRQASEARRARKAIASRWDEYRALRRRIFLGGRRLTITVDDARRAGLCELGIQGFLHRVGLGGRTHFPGRLLAALSYVDRQVGYAVFAGHLRQQAEEASRLGGGAEAAADRAVGHSNAL